MNRGEMISVLTDDGHSFAVYLSGGAAADTPVVLLYPPIFGLEERVLTIADRWANEGFLVAVPDYLSRAQPAGVLDRSEHDMKLAVERWNRIDMLRAIEDSRALLARLTLMGWSTVRFGALGYCGGGELAWLAASRLGATAVAAFHPTRLTGHLDEAPGIKGAISLHFAAQDSIVPLQEVAQIQAALAPNPCSEVHVYGGARHSFTFTDLPAYHPSAESASYQRALALLRTSFQRKGEENN